MYIVRKYKIYFYKL